jgi:hypothetical protein
MVGFTRHDEALRFWPLARRGPNAGPNAVEPELARPTPPMYAPPLSGADTTVSTLNEENEGSCTAPAWPRAKGERHPTIANENQNERIVMIIALRSTRLSRRPIAGRRILLLHRLDWQAFATKNPSVWSYDRGQDRMGLDIDSPLCHPVTIDKIRAFYDAQPFQPFVIHMADGRQVPVHHPDFMAAAPSGRTVTVYQPDDTLNVIDLLLVTDLEAKRPSNGARRRKR